MVAESFTVVVVGFSVVTGAGPVMLFVVSAVVVLPTEKVVSAVRSADSLSIACDAVSVEDSDAAAVVVPSMTGPILVGVTLPQAAIRMAARTAKPNAINVFFIFLSPSCVVPL